MSTAALSLTSLRPAPPRLVLPPPDGDDVIQPSKAWVLPARGKPGRKPSATVPATKRKAQNRASQRAFRERRHAYVTELEEKVAQFEAREIHANVQLQRIAQKYREEADYLRQSQHELLTRCESLERDLSTCQRRMASIATHASGCRPPPHEQRPGAEAPNAMSPIPLAAAKLVPLRRKREPSPPLAPPSEVEERSLDVDCGFCTDDTVCVCRGQARLDLDPVDACASWPAPAATLRKTRLWYTTTASPPTEPSVTAPSVRLPSRSRPRQRLWPVTNDLGALRCTGDQRTCEACQSDPALAQFCTAVSRRCRLPVSMQRDDKAVSRESVPHAFTRLRHHPNFSAWRGGLDMLAEVVARDPILASSVASPPLETLATSSAMPAARHELPPPPPPPVSPRGA
ncbi:hypothetical protein MARU1_000609 [Malassezia arunalokei]|uniref:BZIP domain-containing protein n=1 Tax=Malassezia arunalokei TaxID=1514897 RepID=A0AAJ6CLK4_9BASI|nr:hypothetical protein MARU1_000609 [Malassezia arunalokei]